MCYGVYLATLMYVSDMYYNWENYLTVTGGYQHAVPLPGVTSLTTLHERIRWFSSLSSSEAAPATNKAGLQERTDSFTTEE